MSMYIDGKLHKFFFTLNRNVDYFSVSIGNKDVSEILEPYYRGRGIEKINDVCLRDIFGEIKEKIVIDTNRENPEEIKENDRIIF